MWAWLSRRLRRPAPVDLIAEGEPAVCACGCHANPGMMHARPCCRPCARCGARFSSGLRAHERDCDGKPGAETSGGS